MSGTEVRNSFVIASARRAANRFLPKMLAFCFVAAVLPAYAAAATPQGYVQTNLISNGSVHAFTVDPNFINPWGVSIGPDFWINTTGSGLDYIANASGGVSFKVTIPPATRSGLGSPTGTVFTGGGILPAGAFLLPDKSSPQFLFCSIDGTVSGWSGGDVLIALNNHKPNDVYTAMAILTNSKGTYVLLANAGAGADVQAYGPRWLRAMPNAFKDPNLPSGYAPFGVHVFNGTVYVAYAPQPGAKQKPAFGEGKGFVDAFDENGVFVKRVIPLGGKLNYPWGMAIAPKTFGEFAGDVLVGNFGDGTIAAYDSTTWLFKGFVADKSGNKIANPGLWEIVFGTGKAGAGDPNTLYFAAGIEQEKGGLFGTIKPAGTAVTKTRTTVVSDGNPDNVGIKVTFTALVQPMTGFGEPEGSVKFTVDGTALAAAPVDSTAHAAASTSKLAVGKHVVTASYSGDSNFAASSGTVTQTIQTPTAAAPAFSPAAGTFGAAQTVTIADSTPHATIHYTVDGTTPATSSAVYTKPFQVSATTTVKAIATAPGMAASPVASVKYTITAAAPTATPTFSPAAGLFYSAQNIAIADTTSGAKIYYTVDGSTPTASSSVYSKPVSVSKTMTIKAMAIAPGWADSTVASGTFTIDTGSGW